MITHFLCGLLPKAAPMLRYNLFHSIQFMGVATALVIILYYSSLLRLFCLSNSGFDYLCITIIPTISYRT